MTYCDIQEKNEQTTTEIDTRIFVGKVEQVFGLTSAINKHQTSSSLYLSEQGLEGDECAELKFHGGAERALHHYPAEHYLFWQIKYSESVSKWAAPGMGENISTLGMNEENVCIGDQYQWGEAIIEVSQPRSPCYKLNQRWDVADVSTSMQQLSRCGWLYRVIKSGMVDSNSRLTLITREENALTVKQVCDIFFGDPLNKEALLSLQAINKLSINWQRTIQTRLTSGKLENWNFRLLGHA
ncbi:MOSC domain-containing protein [Aliivibrio sp.]|uniref:MOSC domain-containing protein n=1 Tax=Aliivibrio sp. TaxID=1872443 RepID=UPI003D2F1AEB